MGAAAAAEALGVLAQRRVAVVVADYHLPGIAGLDLLAAIKGTVPNTPLILDSGGMTDELAEERAGLRRARGAGEARGSGAADRGGPGRHESA